MIIIVDPVTGGGESCSLLTMAQLEEMLRAGQDVVPELARIVEPRGEVVRLTEGLPLFDLLAGAVAVPAGGEAHAIVAAAAGGFGITWEHVCSRYAVRERDLPGGLRASRPQPRAKAAALHGWRRQNYAKAGAEWTSVELDNLFRLRHIDKLTDTAIGKLAGISRQAVSQLIGAKEAWKRGPMSRWNPSPSLLNECGLKAPAARLALAA